MTRAAFAIGGVTAFTQLFAFLLSPIYARLYSPSDYGVLSLYVSITATVLTVGSLCYEQAIPIGKNDDEALSIAVLAIGIVALIATLTLLVLLSVGQYQLSLGRYLWLVPFGIVFGGTFKVINLWAIRRKTMTAIAQASLCQFLVSSCIILGFGFLSPSPLGLILAAIAASSSGVSILAARTGLLHALKAKLRPMIRSREIFAAGRRYSTFPRIQAPSTALNSLGLYLPGLLAVPYFGAEFAGQLFMALKIMALPGNLIGGALGQVFFSGAAAMVRERPKEFAPFVRRVFIRGLICSLVIPVIGISGRWLVPYLLGVKWKVSGEIVLWLSLYCTLGLTVSAISTIPSVVGRLRGQFFINLARAVTVALLFVATAYFDLSGMTFVKAYAVTMILNYIACFCLYFQLVKNVAKTGVTIWEYSAA